MTGAKKPQAPGGASHEFVPVTANRNVAGGRGRAQFRLTTGFLPVGAGFTVQFSYWNGQVDVRWAPRPPSRYELSRVLDRYRGHRHAFLVDIGQLLGGTVACVEV